MGSSKSASRKKATEDSIKFKQRKFADFGTSPNRNTRYGSTDSYAWMHDHLALDTASLKANGEIDDQTPIASQEERLAFQSRQPSLTVKKKGTGFHDNKLAKCQGKYRQASLRRGSGTEYRTPEVFGKVTSKRDQNV